MSLVALLLGGFFSALFPKAMISRLEAYNNNVGVMVRGDSAPAGIINMIVSDSIIHNNVSAGVDISTSLSGAQIFANVLHSRIANNLVGVRAEGAGHAELTLAQSALTGNAESWRGEVSSLGNNYIYGNNDNDPATPLTIPFR